MRQMWAKRISCTADCDFTWQDEEKSTARTHTVLKPDLVFLFGPADLLRASGAAERLAGTYPGAILIGCSSGTMVSAPHLLDDVMTGLAVGFERTRVKLATVDFEGAPSSEAAGRALGAQLAAPDLAGVFVLSDGLDINGSALVKGLAATAGDKATFSGGLAGDGARFSQTLVTVGGPPRSKLVAAIGFYGDSVKLAYGSAGGWDEFGPHRRITRAEGNVLFELDDKPALDLYERYLGPEARDLPASGLLYPLKVWDPERSGDSVVRTILSIDREARSMTFAGDVPQGWSSRLMRGSFDRLTQGAAEAAAHAAASSAMAGVSPKLCLFVSCVGRRLLMGQRTEEEVEAVQNVLGGRLPIAGFYSYGEIAPQNASGVCGLHNQTVTLTLIGEAA